MLATGRPDWGLDALWIMGNQGRRPADNDPVRIRGIYHLRRIGVIEHLRQSGTMAEWPRSGPLAPPTREEGCDGHALHEGCGKKYTRCGA
jgi:hypothetical protein